MGTLIQSALNGCYPSAIAPFDFIVLYIFILNVYFFGQEKFQALVIKFDSNNFLYQNVKLIISWIKAKTCLKFSTKNLSELYNHADGAKCCPNITWKMLKRYYLKQNSLALFWKNITSPQTWGGNCPFPQSRTLLFSK